MIFGDFEAASRIRIKLLRRFIYYPPSSCLGCDEKRRTKRERKQKVERWRDLVQRFSQGCGIIYLEKLGIDE